MPAPQKQQWADEIENRAVVWENKRALRRIYQRWHGDIRSACVDGATLEIGGGSGQLKEYWPEVLTTDLVGSPHVDVCADCLSLPFSASSFDNIVGIDILHHVADLDTAMKELARTVRHGGRLVFVEPYVSMFSGLVRNLFHQEKSDLKVENIFGPSKNPEDGNLAIPTKVFWREKNVFENRFPFLRLVRTTRSDVIAYPLTGGFGRANLFPEAALNLIRSAEFVLKPLLPLLAFKTMLVVEVRH
jgi:SAM-dependent methyltransferase